MDIREIAHLAPNYYEINREERNYTAILFAALCKPGNAERFIEKLGFEELPGPEFGIYVEYSYLRDLWNTINDNEIKKNIIREHLKIKKINEILKLPVMEINRKFGVGSRPSKDFIQFPGRWVMTNFHKNFTDNEDFLKICRFKWSFNIKPDIVIHLDRDRAICIEAKYESKEGFYPASSNEKKIFAERNLPGVGQMELQKYLMEQLLGIQTDFIFLASRQETSATHTVLTWAEAFANLDLVDLPPFALEMIERISGPGQEL